MIVTLLEAPIKTLARFPFRRDVLDILAQFESHFFFPSVSSSFLENMDIFISGSKDGITMVEGCGMEFPEDRLLNILDEALKLFTPVINLILDMKSKISKKEFISNIPLDSHLCSTQLSEEIENHSSILNLKSKLFTQSSKQEREKRRFFWGG